LVGEGEEVTSSGSWEEKGRRRRRRRYLLTARFFPFLGGRERGSRDSRDGRRMRGAGRLFVGKG